MIETLVTWALAWWALGKLVGAAVLCLFLSLLLVGAIWIGVAAFFASIKGSSGR